MAAGLINIAFIMNGAKHPRGGEFLTLYLIKHLRRDIFNPVVIHASEGLIVEEIRKTGVEMVHVPLAEWMTNVYPGETKLYSPFFVARFFLGLLGSGHLFTLLKLLKKRRIDLIYSADNLSKLTGGLAGKVAGIKVAAHCHDDFKEDFLGRVMRMWYLLFIGRLLTVSEKVRGFFKVNGKIPAKVVTVYNGVDAAVYDPEAVPAGAREELGIERGSFLIGLIGSLDENKGHQYLLEAIRLLKSEGFALKCIICGKGPERGNLEALARSNGLSTDVLFLGFRRDVPRIMKSLDALVVPSVHTEACSMTILEAQAMGLPVIATSISGNPELVAEGLTGLLVPPGDSEALAEAIKSLIRDPVSRLRMGRRARETVLERFTIERNVRKTEEIFIEFLGEGGVALPVHDEPSPKRT